MTMGWWLERVISTVDVRTGSGVVRGYREQGGDECETVPGHTEMPRSSPADSFARSFHSLAPRASTRSRSFARSSRADSPLLAVARDGAASVPRQNARGMSDRPERGSESAGEGVAYRRVRPLHSCCPTFLLEQYRAPCPPIDQRPHRVPVGQVHYRLCAIDSLFAARRPQNTAKRDETLPKIRLPRTRPARTPDRCRGGRASRWRAASRRPTGRVDPCCSSGRRGRRSRSGCSSRTSR